MEDDLKYKIGITLIPKIGAVNAKKLIAYCGGVEAVFKESKKALLKIPGIGENIVKNILGNNVLARAEQEIEFIEKHKITPLFYTDDEYPKRLLQCEDGPVMLYYKGNVSLNKKRVLAVVGTRRSTPYGKIMCENILEGLKEKDVLVVSGLAYGIDSCAHRFSVNTGISTVGVLGHGLDRIYPSENKSVAKKMVTNGGLLTEFMSGTTPDRENFPKRNRIIAGISDATLVVESGRKGGAIITADIAFSYNRDVFAVPGRVNDQYSKGCNYLLKTNKAAMAESADDIAYLLGWDDVRKEDNRQLELFSNLTADEQTLIEILQKYGECGVDELMVKSGLQLSKIASALLNMEFKGIILSLPGKRYRVK